MASYWILHCNQSFDPSARPAIAHHGNRPPKHVQNFKQETGQAICCADGAVFPTRSSKCRSTVLFLHLACLPSCLVCRQRQNQLLQKEQLGLSGRYQTHSFPKRPFVTKHHKSRQFIFLSVPNTMRTGATAGQGLHATSQACNRTRVMASRFRILFFFG